MNYIVLDMEWNQPWPGSPSAKKVLPVAIRGEIIQIGAVRVTEDQQVADEFQVLIKPKYYKRLNRRVSKLTGIKETDLRDRGVSILGGIVKLVGDLCKVFLQKVDVEHRCCGRQDQT